MDLTNDFSYTVAVGVCGVDASNRSKASHILNDSMFVKKILLF